MIITIGGLPCTGTSTLAKALAEKYGLEVINAGQIFRNMAKKYNMSLEEFGKYMENNPNVDKEIDMKMIEITLKKDNIILEGRLIGQYLCNNKINKNLHFRKPNLSIWLKANDNIKIKRLMNRENLSYNEASYQLINREKSEYYRYKENFKIDLNDLSIYDLIIDSGKFSTNEILKMLEVVIINEKSND